MLGIPPLALASAFALGQVANPLSPEPRRLVAGERIEESVSDTGARSYHVALGAGEFLRLSLLQDNVDVIVTLSCPPAEPVEIDVADSRYGREPASILADATTTCAITVRAKESDAGRFDLESAPLRRATEQDRARAAGEADLAGAVQLLRGERKGGPTLALERFDQAFAHFRAIEDRYWEAETLLQRAAAHAAVRDLVKVNADTAAAISLIRETGDRRGEARAHWIAGGVQASLFEYDGAAASYERAVALYLAIGDQHAEGYALRDLGWAHSQRGEKSKPAEIARRTYAVFQRVGDRKFEAWALMDLGAAQGNSGDYQGALQSFREALPVFRSVGDRQSEGIAYQRIGSLLSALGDYAGAAAATREALAIFARHHDTDGQGTAYIVLAGLHVQKGEHEKALELYADALALFRQAGNQPREGQTLTRMGAALIGQKKYEIAEGRLQEALRISRQARNTGNEAAALMSLAESHIETGRAEEARAEIERAAGLLRALGNGSEAKAHYLLARIAREGGDLETARVHVEAALRLLEGKGRALTSPTIRSTFVAATRQYYDLYVEVLVGLHLRHPGQGFDERALEAAEAARARGLLAQFAQGGIEVRQGVEPALLDQEASADARLSAALERQLRLSQQPAAAEQVTAASREVERLTLEVEAARDTVRTRSPRFAELREPTIATVAEIRKDVLDDETVLLEYALGEKRSFLWVVTRTSLAVHELPPRAVVEQMAREAHARLTEPPPLRHRRHDVLERFSRMVVGPAAGSMGGKRLLIVADGGLHYVPFAALPDPERPGRTLLAGHEVVGAPSASVLGVLRREQQARVRAPKTLAVLADPVFDRSDERLGRSRVARTLAATPGGDEALARALRSAGADGVLHRLPFTRREASAISSLVPPDERKEALDFDASRAAATHPSLADYRLVHFATHGFLNSAQPEHSGIILSLVDRDGRPVPGLLTASDVLNLRFGADLVVLSGCRTALGREMRGEGLVGLSRSFMYAGAPRVVASLWKVDDAATAELMAEFYRGMLVRGQRPAAALRAAQRHLVSQRRFRDPYYWAAFQLQGEWR